jgi:hypothetical protein
VTRVPIKNGNSGAKRIGQRGQSSRYPWRHAMHRLGTIPSPLNSLGDRPDARLRSSSGRQEHRSGRSTDDLGLPAYWYLAMSIRDRSLCVRFRRRGSNYAPRSLSLICSTVRTSPQA